MAIRSPAIAKSNQNLPISRGWLWEVRSRILLWYAALLLGLLALALPLVRYRVLSQVDIRVDQDLEEDVGEFQALRQGDLLPIDRLNIEQLQRKQPQITFTLTPRTFDELKTLMNVYLARSIPEDDTFLIAIVNGQFYRSSPRALPKGLRPGQPAFERLVQIQESDHGMFKVEEEKLGNLIYYIEPIRSGERVLGSMMAVHLTLGERREALEAIQEMVYVLVFLVILASGVGWFLFGRLLAPLQGLTVLTQQVSVSDLSQRIPVKGKGELAELAQAFNRMMGRLDASFQTQRHLINDAGHELRTPITIVRGHLELMGDDPIEIEETRELVIDELDRMSRLVDELILLAKSERPDFLRPESLSLPKFMNELYAKVQYLGDRSWQLGPMGLGNIQGDRQRLTEAILNLAENAVQHTQPTDSITLGSRFNNGRLELWVKDTGEGIAPQDQERIFERFTRVSNSRRSEGCGLGLAIVQAIAEAHGGWVELFSEVNRGSQFTLVLPLEGPQ